MSPKRVFDNAISQELKMPKVSATSLLLQTKLFLSRENLKPTGRDHAKCDERFSNPRRSDQEADQAVEINKSLSPPRKPGIPSLTYSSQQRLWTS